MADGFVRFDNYGLDIDHLVAESMAALKKAGNQPDNAITTGKMEKGGLQSISPILQSKEILELASAYLGDDVRIAGYKVVRLGSKVTTKEYISGIWHHDSCGSRIKLFVFLEDVGEDGAATEVARGSQNLAFWNYGGGFSRFDHDYVTTTWGTPEKMIGPRGGGFMFDTNSVHKGNVDGIHPSRDTIILDIDMAKKLDTRIPGKGPCPAEGGTMRLDLDFPLPGS
jgi:hypothetical protein